MTQILTKFWETRQNSRKTWGREAIIPTSAPHFKQAKLPYMVQSRKNVSGYSKSPHTCNQATLVSTFFLVNNNPPIKEIFHHKLEIRIDPKCRVNFLLDVRCNINPFCMYVRSILRIQPINLGLKISY